MFICTVSYGGGFPPAKTYQMTNTLKAVKLSITDNGIRSDNLAKRKAVFCFETAFTLRETLGLEINLVLK